MAAKPDNPDDFATRGDLYNESQAIREDMQKMERSIRHDIASLARMVRTIMDHLGISEPPPPAR